MYWSFDQCVCSFDLRNIYLDYPATPAIDFTTYLKFNPRLVLHIVVFYRLIKIYNYIYNSKYIKIHLVYIHGEF